MEQHITTLKEFYCSRLPRLVLGILLVMLFNTVSAKAQRNTVLIIADDLGIDYCGFYENHQDTASLPNIRSLLSKGVLFNKAMSNPVCSSTRSGIFTGQYSFRTGVGNVVGGIGGSNPLDTAEMCIPKLLQIHNPNINKAQFGKWHLHTGQTPNLLNPNRMGWDHYVGNFSGTLSSYTNWTKITDGVSSTSTTYATTDITNEAISWISSQDPTQPFFLWLAYNAPHSPYHLPPAGLHSYTGLSGTTGDINTHPVPYFKASLEALDHEVGRLFDSLQVTGQMDSTDFIFIGDNGNALQVSQIANSSRAKGTLYDYGIHVPFLISGPSVITPGRISNALVNTADIFATVLELMDVGEWTQYIPANKPVDSHSLLPILLNQTDSIRPWAFSEIFKIDTDSSDGKTMRNLNYKLFRFDYGAEEFYHLSSDPEETINLLLGTLSIEQQSNYNYLCTEMTALTGTGNLCINPLENHPVGTSTLIELYPNPTQSVLTISNCAHSPLYIYNSAGQCVKSLPATDSQSQTIDISDLRDGLYFLYGPESSRSSFILQR